MRSLAFIICSIILFARGSDRLIHPALWAEDGTVFFMDALQKGWSCIFTPYEGYFHLFNRISMQLISYFPLTYTPALVTTLCFALYAWVMSIFAHRKYRSIVESDTARIMISAGLCLLPGTYEMLGSLCNTHRILATALLFLAIKPEDEKLTTKDLLLTFLVMGSAGEALFFLPLFLYRIYKRLKIKKSLDFISKEIQMITIMVGWTIANILARTTNSTPPQLDWERLATVTLHAFSFHFSMMPILGWRLTENLARHALPILWVLSTFFTFTLFKDLFKNFRTPRVKIYLSAACLFAIQGLVWIVRPVDIGFYDQFPPGLWMVNGREVFGLAFAGFLLWSVFFAHRGRTWGIAFVLLYFTLLPELKVKSHGESHWSEQAALLEKSIQTGCPKSVELQFFPVQWKTTFVSNHQQISITCSP